MRATLNARTIESVAEGFFWRDWCSDLKFRCRFGGTEGFFMVASLFPVSTRWLSLTLPNAHLQIPFFAYAQKRHKKAIVSYLQLALDPFFTLCLLRWFRSGSFSHSLYEAVPLRYCTLDSRFIVILSGVKIALRPWGWVHTCYHCRPHLYYLQLRLLLGHLEYSHPSSLPSLLTLSSFHVAVFYLLLHRWTQKNESSGSLSQKFQLHHFVVACVTFHFVAWMREREDGQASVQFRRALDDDDKREWRQHTGSQSSFFLSLSLSIPPPLFPPLLARPDYNSQVPFLISIHISAALYLTIITIVHTEWNHVYGQGLISRVIIARLCLCRRTAQAVLSAMVSEGVYR